MPGFLRKLLAIFCALFCLALNGLHYENRTAKLVRVPSTFETQIDIPVKDGNFLKARKTALAYGIKDALSQALEYFLGDYEKTINSSKLKKIFSNPTKYVKSYNFLYAEDNLYDMREEVGLQITLYSDALKKNLRSLGVLSKSKNQNSILILIREIGLSVSGEMPFWDYVPISETILTQKFKKAGIAVIPRNKLKEVVSEEVVLRAIQGDLSAALEIGNQVGVNNVIVGNAATSKSRLFEDEIIDRIQANISVKTISVIKGTVIAAKSDFASIEGEDSMKDELKAYEKVSIGLSTFLLNSLKLQEENLFSPNTSESSDSTRRPLPFNDL